MKQKKVWVHFHFFSFLIGVVFLLSGNAVYAQHTSPKPPNLSLLITFKANNQRLEQVLDRISNKGDFYFSYSGTIPKDSLITISVQNKPIREVLEMLFQGKADFKDSGNYIIIRSTILHLSIIPEKIDNDESRFFISGFVVDNTSGEKVKNASVYERKLLQSTLTNSDGYFKLRFKGDHKSVLVTVSKEAYRDTTMLFLSAVNIKPEGYTFSDEQNEGYRSPTNRVEKFGFARFLVSSGQRIQSLNIPDFFANSPVQASLTPGLSSHGMMSSQVVNKASLNLIGGYTAGVDGIEVAGVFNINKQSVRYVQVGGVSNMVGGSATGVQVAGVLNTVLDNTNGVQVAGVANLIKKQVTGVQIAGVVNTVGGSLTGIQVAGVVNLLKDSLKGVQVAGVLNHNYRDVKGVQVAGLGNLAGKKLTGIQVGLFNYAKNAKGIQVGFMNVADTSSGVSIGLVNLVRKGYHKISISSNDVMNINMSLKTGNANFYTMLIAGMNKSNTESVTSGGYGFGHDFLFNKRFSASAELTSQALFLGLWDYPNILSKGQLNFQVRLRKGLALFAGPSYSVYRSDPNSKVMEGFKKNIAPSNAHIQSANTKTWIGWNVGLTLF